MQLELCCFGDLVMGLTLYIPQYQQGFDKCPA